MGKHAVEDVHAARHRFKEVFGGAYAHKVTRLVGGQNRIEQIEHAVHLLFRFTDGQPADGIAGKVKIHQEAR